MIPLVVTYWTDDRYKTLADAMFASASKIGLTKQKGYYRENPTGTWRAGDSAKPEMVLKAVTENPGEDIMFVDADCRFISFPALVDPARHDMTLACVFENPNLPMSTVVWLRKGPAGLAYAKRWYDEMKKSPDTPNDMFALSRAVRATVPKSVLVLPPSYAWTEQWMRPRFGGVEPVIEHFSVGEHNFPGVHVWGKTKHTLFKD